MQKIYTGKVIAALLQKDGRYFIAQRAKGSCEGLWEFPGGKQEEGETCEECLVRELFEEFGIQAKVGEYVCSSFFMLHEKPAELMAYSVHSYEGTIMPYEHAQIRWVLPEEFCQYAFAEPDLVFIDHILNIAAKHI